MQFERIRKNHKRKIIIGGLILVCVISAITITTTRAKYKLTEDIPIVRGYINYIADREKPIINNVTTSVTKTEINVSVTATDNIGVTEYWYQINSNTPVKGIGNTYKFTGLSAGTTYTLKVYVKDAKGNQSDTTTKSVTTDKPTGSETILGNVTVKTGAPDFSKSATTDEGVYKVYDDMYDGYSYYWRGAVTNNYVKFGGFCWRIIRINGDGTMRLIYDGTTCHANGTKTVNSLAVDEAQYHRYHDQSNYVGWTYSETSQRTLSGTASGAKKQLDSWYQSKLSSYASKIAYGKFCNNRNVASGGIWSVNGSAFNYGSHAIFQNDNPSLACNSGDVYSLKVGLITADEVMYAGGIYEDNTSYYLYNGYGYWTMSPASWRSNSASVYYVSLDGRPNTYPTDYVYGLRPVINLRSDVTFSSGNGTKSNPYVVA